MARSLLLEFIGGEPGEAMHDSVRIGKCLCAEGIEADASAPFTYRDAVCSHACVLCVFPGVGYRSGTGAPLPPKCYQTGCN
jgi:hypothetical protein